MQKEFIIEDGVLIKCLDVIEQTVHLESGGTKILMKCCFTVPEGVREIGNFAFGDCDDLQTVHYGGSAAQRGAIDDEIYNSPLFRAQWVYKE